MTNGNQPIVFFDGVCNFCNSSVRLIIKKDPKAVFKLAPLQSDHAQSLLSEDCLNEDSIVLLENGKCYTKSTAALKIATKMSGLYPLLVVFRIVPRVLRDIIYDYVASNRYRWFGKKDQCMIPDSDISDRFL